MADAAHLSLPVATLGSNGRSELFESRAKSTLIFFGDSPKILLCSPLLFNPVHRLKLESIRHTIHSAPDILVSHPWNLDEGLQHPKQC